MSVGLGLIKAVVVNDLPFSDIVESGIDETFLKGAEKDVYEFVKAFKYKHNVYPKLETIEAEVPNAVFGPFPDEPVEYWATELRNRKKFWLLSKANSDVAEYLNKGNVNDAALALKLANDALLHINQEFTVEDLAKIQEDVVKRHNEVQQTVGISGIPFGYKLLDNLTYGQQPGDFNVLIGPTGSCKSYFSFASAKEAHVMGKNVMTVSPEMPTQQIARRLLAMQLNVPDSDLRKGKLSYYAIQKAQKLINAPVSIEGEDVKNWFKLLPSGIYSDVNQIINIAGEYKPDLLLIDGFYMLKNRSLKTSSSWQEQESVIYLLKNFSLHSNIPILATTQYNRSSPGKLEGAKGTQAVEIIASNFLSLEFETPADRESHAPVQYRNLKVKKSRDGDYAAFKYEFDFNRTTIRELDMTEGYVEPEYEDSEYLGEL